MDVSEVSISSKNLSLTFSKYIAVYPTWEKLKQFLESEEGGKLRTIPQENDRFVIIRYEKGNSDFSKEWVPQFRSVVWDTKTNLPVCAAPVKAQEGEPPVNTCFRVSNFVNGTMIQAFRFEGEVYLASRSRLGATGNFYSKRSFASLLEDAVKGSVEKFLKSVLLHDGTFASFVLQHPEHKTVGEIDKAKLFCTYEGIVMPNGDVSMSNMHEFWSSEILCSMVPQVNEYNMAYKDPEEIRELMRNYQLGYSWQGFVFQDLNSNLRWRLRNPFFEIVKTMRGNESSPLERFLRIRSQKLVKEYLEYFPEENGIFWSYEKLLRTKTNDLYCFYNSLRKEKSIEMKDVPYQYRSHLHALHGMYISSSSSSSEKTPITKQKVVEYVNNTLGIRELFLLL